jgi:hypothetical protein
LLVHEWVGKQPDGTRYGISHGVEPGPDHHPSAESKWYMHHELPGNTEFDELVVGQWLHVEQQDATRWWMNIGGVTIWVTADRDGRPRHVTVYAPGDYAMAVPGCEYSGAVAP